MRLVWLELNGYRRFERAKINLDAPVIALVGPNEAGKSTLLKALVSLDNDAAFDIRDFTRGMTPQNTVLQATFLLDGYERDALRRKVPDAYDVRWYRVSKDVDGELHHETIPKIEWTGETAVDARKSLTRLRQLRWADDLPQNIIDQIDAALSRIPVSGHSRTYSEEELADFRRLNAQLEELQDKNSPATLEHAIVNLGVMIVDEDRERPQVTALNFLEGCVPSILEFSASDRTLNTSYELTDRGTWTDGLQNLAQLADLELNDLVDAIHDNRPEVREDIISNATSKLNRILAERWSQSNLRVHLDVQGSRLEIFVATDGGKLHRLAERSDGLRIYLALIAFLGNNEQSIPPILTLDEAESHLHWDAQADLINLLYHQDIVSQVIYSTHSPGCLPHDLGCGVRSIAPTGSDRSKVTNWIWENEAGYRPLLHHMGASTAALTPHRFAVATEGVSDFILLPALLRAALELDSLPYQIVPGIAQLSRDGFRTIDSESDTTVYLTDGDASGTKLEQKANEAGIPEQRIRSLPDGNVLEDLICDVTLIAAIEEELRRSGQEFQLPSDVPEHGCWAFIEQWFRDEDVKMPSKRAIASRVLELVARRSDCEAMPLLEERYRSVLIDLHDFFVTALGTEDD